MQVELLLERFERPFDSITLSVDTEVKWQSGFSESKHKRTTLTASFSVCSPSPDNSGLKLLWCVDWLQPLSFLVISFITYSQFMLAPLISLPQQGDVGCRWLMKNRIGFGVRQTECRHQSQNALIFNNPHLHVYKWYNQGLLALILPLPNRRWHTSWRLQTAWEAHGRAWGVCDLAEGARGMKVLSWLKLHEELLCFCASLWSLSLSGEMKYGMIDLVFRKIGPTKWFLEVSLPQGAFILYAFNLHFSLPSLRTVEIKAA